MSFRSFLFTIPAVSLITLLPSCNKPDKASMKAGENINNSIAATVETQPTSHGKNDDSADDPAFWINSQTPENSIIIATDKKGGMITYNLQGKELFYFLTGKMNNCDLRYGFPLNGDSVDVVAASNRTFHSLSLFRIHKNGRLDSLHSRIICSEMKEEVYGLCMYKSKKTGKFYVFMNSKAGEVEQWELLAKGNRIDAALVRSFSFKTQTEGMVADDDNGFLYIGEEKTGIYKLEAEPDGAYQPNLLTNSTEANLNIKFDIEGLAIYATDPINGYLIASSQGNFSYAIFERQGDNKYLRSFRIVGENIDGVEETDGLEVTSFSLGPKFPEGALIVQDGFNYDGKKKKAQNFKIVSWNEISGFLKD